MTESSPLPYAQGNAGDGPLRTLAGLHFAAAGLFLAGIVVLYWHYWRIHGAFLDVVAWKHQQGGDASLEPFFAAFRRYHFVAGAALAGCAIANLFSGLLIWKRACRAVSLLVACLNCFLVPVGTVFGAFTIVVLLRDSARQAYGARADSPNDR